MVVMDMEDDAVVVEDPSAQMVTHIPVAAHARSFANPLAVPSLMLSPENKRVCVCSMLNCFFLVVDLLYCAVAGLQFCMVRCAGVRV